jgi:hypothetical protein
VGGLRNIVDMVGSCLGGAALVLGTGSAAAAPGAPAVDPAAAARAMSTSLVVSTMVPVVAFAPEVTVSGGRLRTPVLLADPTVTATSHVEGGRGPGCDLVLLQGTARWLDCAIETRGEVRTVVTLSDGRTVVQEVRRRRPEPAGGPARLRT